MKRRIKMLLSIGLALLFCLLPTSCALTPGQTTSTSGTGSTGEQSPDPNVTLHPSYTDSSYYDGWSDYSLVKTSNPYQYYISFDDISRYERFSGLGGSFIACLSFDNMHEFKTSVRGWRLTDAQKRNLVRSFEKNENGFKSCNFDNLYIPVTPGDYTCGAVNWYGSNYIVSVKGGDYNAEVQIYNAWQEEFVDYFKRWCVDKIYNYTSAGIEKIEEVEDRNARVIYHHGQKYILYTIQDEVKTLIVNEEYQTKDAECPARIRLYCFGVDCSYMVYIYSPTSRPSVEWLLEFGVEPYVDTPAE